VLNNKYVAIIETYRNAVPLLREYFRWFLEFRNSRNVRKSVWVCPIVPGRGSRHATRGSTH